MAGKFVVIEGSDGSGKTIQIQLLTAFLRREEVPFQTISFPRYNSNNAGRAIQKYLSGEFGDPTKVNPYLASLPYAIDQGLAKDKIQNWLKMGDLVIADRYLYSNLAFQAAKLKDKDKPAFRDWLLDLELKDIALPKENLVLYLYVPTEISSSLMSSRNKDGHEKNQNFQKEVEKEYSFLAKGKNWITINCVQNGKMLPKEKIHQEIVKVLAKRGYIKVRP